MPVVGIVVALLAGAAIGFWQFRMLHNAADLAITAIAPLRSHAPAIASVDDPALAEAVFLLALGRECSGDPAAVRARIGRQLAAVAPGARDELMRYAEWAGSSADPKDCIRRFKTLWLKRLNPAQRQQLIAMGEAVARHGGAIESRQKITLAALRLALAS